MSKSRVRRTARRQAAGVNVASFSWLRGSKMLLFLLVFAAVGAYALYRGMAADTITMNYANLNAVPSHGESVVTETGRSKRNLQVVEVNPYDANGRAVFSKSVAPAIYRACFIGVAHRGTPQGSFVATHSVDGQVLTSKSYTAANTTRYQSLACMAVTHASTGNLFFTINVQPVGVSLRISFITLEKTGDVQPPDPTDDRPVGNISGIGSLVFRDEFNDTTVDPNVWARSWFGTTNGYSNPINGSEDGCYHVDQATEHDGFLWLTTAQSGGNSNCRKRDGSIAPIKSGIVSSIDKKEFRYGYFEAEIELDGPYNWPAWWTNGHHNDHPDRGELDIIELLSSRRQCANVHFTTLESGSQCVSSFLSGTHVYGMKWTPNTVQFFYDGAPISREFSVQIPYDHYLVLNHGVREDYSNGMSTGRNMKVNYVRVWGL